MRLSEPFWNYWDLLIALGLIVPAYTAYAILFVLLGNAPKIVIATIGTLVFYGVQGGIAHWKAALAGVALAHCVSLAGAAFEWMRSFSESTISASIMHASCNLIPSLAAIGSYWELSR